MAGCKLPSPEYLRKRLEYYPETGELYWLDCEEMPRPWRAHWPGRAAGSTVNGYRKIGISGRPLLAHRVAWAIYYGEWPASHIDHINGIRSDNRLVNLRSVERSENMRNIARPSTNKSGVIGVHWRAVSKRWLATIDADPKDDGSRNRLVLGYFTNKRDAIAARKAAERKYGYHPNHGRVAVT